MSWSVRGQDVLVHTSVHTVVLFSPTRVRLHHGEHLNERDGEEEWEKSLGGGVVEIDDCFIAESTPFEEEERRAFFISSSYEKKFWQRL